MPYFGDFSLFSLRHELANCQTFFFALQAKDSQKSEIIMNVMRHFIITEPENDMKWLLGTALKMANAETETWEESRKNIHFISPLRDKR